MTTFAHNALLHNPAPVSYAVPWVGKRCNCQWYLYPNPVSDSDFKKKTPPKPSPFTWRLRGIYIQILPLWKFQMHSQDNILVNFQLHYWFYAGFSLDTQSLQLRQFISEADAGNDILLMKRPCIWTSFTPSWRNKMKEQDEVILKAPHP